ncbi:hypothetical protein BDC45DRAFT_536903 [Circinella umbellata]|nr:hypothetical protein BDC45DRAFT_536903 [Circinella umbellata]
MSSCIMEKDINHLIHDIILPKSSGIKLNQTINFVNPSLFYKVDHSGSVLLKYEQNIQQTVWLAIQADILEANERLQSRYRFPLRSSRHTAFVAARIKLQSQT